MGQQPSKASEGTRTPKNASTTSLDKSGEGLQAYPSFSKSDTKESSRSFRGLRSKIPGVQKPDSPRGSFSQADTTSGNLERADTRGSTKSGASGKSGSSKPELDPVPPTVDGDSAAPSPRPGTPPPPPSPTPVSPAYVSPLRPCPSG